jgi:hypothetical protein
MSVSKKLLSFPLVILQWVGILLLGVLQWTLPQLAVLRRWIQWPQAELHRWTRLLAAVIRLPDFNR